MPGTVKDIRSLVGEITNILINIQVRTAAIETLLEFGDEYLRETLATSSKDPSTRMAATKTIGELGIS
jgi:hypothetical protein